MSPWRRTASQPVQDALDALLGAALDLAEGVLEDHGELRPFAVSLDDEEEMVVTGTDPDDGDPTTAAAVGALVAGLHIERDVLVAAATVCEVRLVDGTDAVRVDLEHVDGVAISVVAPYRRRRLPRAVLLGEATTVAGDPRVWAVLPPAP